MFFYLGFGFLVFLQLFTNTALMQHSVQNFETGLEKPSTWRGGEGLKEFVPQIFIWGRLTVFLLKKDCKIKYDFEDSISNVDFSSAAK